MKISRRFSISFTDTEYESLEKMIAWYKQHRGLSMSRCALIKHLFFEEFKHVEQNSAI